jgi:hypothetical protein
LPGVAVAGGERLPVTVDTQGRIKRDNRSERFGVPCISSRSGPTPTRLVNGVCLASASHCPRPRIGSWDRVTCTSTLGGSYHPPGIVPSQPPGFGTFAPCWVLCTVRSPLRWGLDPLWSQRRRSAFGRSVVERVDGATSTDLPLGGVTSAASHWGLVLAGLHPHPGMATPFRRPVSAGHWFGLFGP